MLVWLRWRTATPPGVESFLLRLAGGSAVVSGAALVGTLPPVMAPTTERATQIDPIRVTRMRQEPDPAVDALHGTATQLRMRLQHRVQCGLVLPNKRISAIILVPIQTKREKLLDADNKKARLSVTIGGALHTPPSYRPGALAPRGRTGIFVALTKKFAAVSRSNRTPRTDCQKINLCPFGSAFSRGKKPALPGKRNNPATLLSK